MILVLKKLVFLTCVIAIISAHSIRSIRSAATCGVSKGPSGFIVRGKPFSRGDFPWTVALMFAGHTPPSFFCGGTLISSTFVVSAAHCILPKYTYVALLPREVIALFGAYDLGNPYENGRITESPKVITLHEEWNPRTVSYDADISLLEFEKGSILFNDDSIFIRPICLWNQAAEPSEKLGLITGWGKSEDSSKVHENKPKLVAAPIQSNEDCFFEAERLLGISSRRTFCAGTRNGSGICHGDSGGGLFLKIRGIYYFKGVVSSSLIKDDTCDVTNFAVYTNVPKFKDWIHNKTQIAVDSSTQGLQLSTADDSDFTPRPPPRAKPTTKVTPLGVTSESTSDDRFVLKWDYDMTNSMETFALHLMYDLHYLNLTENFMVSPFLNYEMLLVVAEGAEGITFNQIKDSLGFLTLMKARVFLQSLKRLLGQTPADNIFRNFAMIITDAARPVAIDFENLIESAYDATIEKVYFAQTDKTLNFINGEVSQLTNKQITHAINREDLYKAQLILLSGLSFQGSWAHSFNPIFTKTEAFHDIHGVKTGEVNMMSQRGSFAYAAVPDLGCQILQLPFDNSEPSKVNYKMFLVLPRKDLEIDDALNNIYSHGMAKIFKAIYDAENDYGDEEVEVHLPRFEISTTFDLRKALEAIGISDVFDQSRANLSKINDRYFVSAMIHKTKITVDEKGKTAAATSISANETIPKFYANRPFIFLIVERVSKLIMFSGQYVTPTLY